MEREIKFRAWDKKDYMSKPFTVYDVQSGAISFTRDTVIVQYTGLKDKNGKEIYEGDIVRGGSLACQGGFKITTITVTVGFESGMFMAGSISLCSVAGQTEVIGNIFESQEESLTPLPQ